MNDHFTSFPLDILPHPYTHIIQWLPTRYSKQRIHANI
jgi:hypothetical protein